MLNIFGTPISARVPSSIASIVGLNTTVQPTTPPKEKKENIVVINNGINEKEKNKVKKPRVPRKKAPAGAIPTEKQKYYQYLTYTAPKLYDADIYNTENDLVSAIRDAFGGDNKENLNLSKVDTGGNFNQQEVEARLRKEIFDTQTRKRNERSDINRRKDTIARREAEERRIEDEKVARAFYKDREIAKNRKMLNTEIDSIEAQIKQLEDAVQRDKLKENAVNYDKLKAGLKAEQAKIKGIKSAERELKKLDAELSADQKSALRNATVKAKAFQEVIVPRGRGRPRKDAGLSTPQPKKNGTRTKVPDTA